MTEYLDIRCGDDLDQFARDVGPLEAYAQDLYHGLITDPQTLIQDPDFGFGLANYLGKPLPSTLASDIEGWARRDERCSDAECTITPIPGERDAYRLALTVAVEESFLTVALKMSPGGIERLA